MNLNGGYIMLDLDDTSNLLNRVKVAYDSGKPLVVKYNYRLQFANFAKRASSSSNYDITLSDNTLLDIHYFSGVLSEKNVVNSRKYRHLIAFTIGVGVDLHKFVFDILTNTDGQYSSVPNAIQSLYSSGCVSENTAMLCVCGDTYAQVYATLSGVTYTLHYKMAGATSFATATNGAFISDTINTL